MNQSKCILLKRAVIGLFATIPAVAISYWALHTYVRSAHPLIGVFAAVFATYYCMTLSMRAAIREAFHAGEVARRLPGRRTATTDMPRVAAPQPLDKSHALLDLAASREG